MWAHLILYVPYIASGFAALVVAVGVSLTGGYRILKETNELLKRETEALRLANQTLTLKVETTEKSICKMQGRIDTLETLPLADIATSMRNSTTVMKDNLVAVSKGLEVSQLNLSINQQILSSLQGSALDLVRQQRTDSAQLHEVAEKLQSQH